MAKKNLITLFGKAVIMTVPAKTDTERNLKTKIDSGKPLTVEEKRLYIDIRVPRFKWTEANVEPAEVAEWKSRGFSTDKPKDFKADQLCPGEVSPALIGRQKPKPNAVPESLNDPNATEVKANIG